MVTKVHRDALRGEIASVRGLIEKMGPRSVLSSASLRKRLEKLETELAKIEGEVSTAADVALIFDGGPVVGSSAIDADFAGRALQDYQELVTKQVASSDFGGLAERGRIQQQAHDEARMNVTALIHGSFGFVLQENRADEPQFLESATKKAVADISTLLADIAAVNRAAFDGRLQEVDSRIFHTLRRFVNNLYKASSTLRISEQEREIKLDQESLGRAYERLRDTEVVETDEVLTGELLGLVPIQRRFELRRQDSGEVIQGRVSPHLSADYLDRLEREGLMAGRTWRAVVRTKTVEHPERRHASITHTLVDLVEL